MDHTRDLFAAIVHYSGRLIEAAPAKLAVAALVTVGGWLTSPGLAQVAVWLLIADWITGTIKAMVRRQVNSDAGVRGAVKSVVYLGVVLGAHAATGAGEPLAMAAGWALVLVASTEALSNLENIKAITSHYGYELPLLDTLIAVLRMRQDQHTSGTGPLPPQQQGGPHVGD